MDGQINIAQITNNLGVGGTQKAMEILVRNLDEDRYNVSVYGYKRDGMRGSDLREDGYHANVVDSLPKFKSALREHDVDVLHMHGMYDTGPEVASAARSAGVPVVLKTTPFGRVKREERGNIDLVLFPSKMSLLRHLRLEHANIQDGGWDGMYRFQYYPLSTEDINNRTGDDLRDDLGIDTETPVVGKIGRSSAGKWSKRMSIEAFERIVAAVPDVRILLVTPPEKIREEIGSRGFESNVIYLDRIPPSEVGKFYNTVDVLTHASAIGESFGYVIAEAMAYETPVVVNSNPMRDNAQVELVNNEETGYVVGSTKAYADATVELLQSDSLRQEYGVAARKRVLSLLSPAPIVDETETIYETLLSSGGDTSVLMDVLSDQHDVVADFDAEYQNRLRDLYGNESTHHQLERLVWTAISRYLPTSRRSIYRRSQGLFKGSEQNG